MLSYVLKSGIAFLSTRWADLGRLLAFPILALIVADFVLERFEVRGIAASLITSAAYVWLAVPTHRLVLLDDQSVPRWGQREWKFLGYLVLLNLIVGIGAGLVALTAMKLLPEAWDFLALVIMLFIAAYVMSMICIVFPAIAVDHPLGFSQAATLLSRFRASAFVVSIVIPIVAAALGGIASFVPFEPLSSLLISIASAFTVVIGVVALSFLYQGVVRSVA
jgi:hypothetical protein